MIAARRIAPIRIGLFALLLGGHAGAERLSPPFLIVEREVEPPAQKPIKRSHRKVITIHCTNDCMFPRRLETLTLDGKRQALDGGDASGREATDAEALSRPPHAFRYVRSRGFVWNGRRDHVERVTVTAGELVETGAALRPFGPFAPPGRGAVSRDGTIGAELSGSPSDDDPPFAIVVRDEAHDKELERLPLAVEIGARVEPRERVRVLLDEDGRRFGACYAGGGKHQLVIRPLAGPTRVQRSLPGPCLAASPDLAALIVRGATLLAVDVASGKEVSLGEGELAAVARGGRFAVVARREGAVTVLGRITLPDGRWQELTRYAGPLDTLALAVDESLALGFREDPTRSAGGARALLLPLHGGAPVILDLPADTSAITYVP